MPLKVVINNREPGIFSVTLFGPLDTATYTTLEKEVKPILVDSTKAVILNMEGVNYISSMGIGAVFNLRKSVQDIRGTLVITNLQPQVKKVFDTVKALPEAIFKSIEEADVYLNEIQRKVLEKDKPSAY